MTKYILFISLLAGCAPMISTVPPKTQHPDCINRNKVLSCKDKNGVYRDSCHIDANWNTWCENSGKWELQE